MIRYVRHDRTKTPVLTLDDYFRATDDDCRVIVLTSRDIAAIRSQFGPNWVWSTRFGSWVDDDLFITADDDQFAEYVDRVNKIDYQLAGGCMPSCYDAFMDFSNNVGRAADALNKMATRECCNGQVGVNGGTAGAGKIQAPASDVDTGEYMGHTGDPPEGFSTWAQYDAYKCSVATWIVDQLLKDLRNMASGSWFGGMSLTAAVGILAFAVATPIPGDELVIIAGIILSAAASGVVSEVTTDAADALQGGRDDIICSLVTGNDVGSARTLATATIGSILDNNLSALAASFSKQVCDRMLSNDSLNRLFVLDTSYTYPEGDCSGCGDQIEAYPYNYGSFATGQMTYETIGPNEVIISSGPDNYNDQVYLDIVFVAQGLPGSYNNRVDVVFEEAEYTGLTQYSGNYAAAVNGTPFNGATVQDLESNLVAYTIPPSEGGNHSAFNNGYLLSGGPFSVRIKFHLAGS